MDGRTAPQHGPRLILGSASPRRLELLAQIGITPHAIRPADIDETETPGETPRAYCARVSRQKAEAIGAEPGIPWISGSFTGIVGLPLSETKGLLRASGLCVETPAA